MVMTPWGDVATARDMRLTPEQLYLMRQDKVMRAERGAGLYGLGATADTNAILTALTAGSASLATPGSGGLIQRIEVQSQVTPTYVYDATQPSAPPTQGGVNTWFLKTVTKPRVIVYGANGIVLYDYKPYGDPVPGKYFWPILAAGGVTGAVAGYFVWKGVVATLKRRGSSAPGPAVLKNPGRRRRARGRRRAHAR